MGNDSTKDKKFIEEPKKKRPNGFKTYPGLKGVTFICDMCGKRTRDTGSNASVKLCPVCYDECMEENMERDGTK